MEEIRFEALAVLRAELMAAALRRANDYRHIGFAAEHEMYFGGAIDYLINSQKREVDSHQFDYRPEPAHRGADAGADDSQFGDWSVAHPLLAIDREQAVGDFERAAEVADFLAHDEDPLVAIEFFAQGLVQCFAVSDLRHRLLILGRVNALAELIHRGLGSFRRRT